MESPIIVTEIAVNEWERLRKIRLASLLENPDAFGGTFDIESHYSEDEWHNRIVKLDFLVASKSKVDIAMMYIEALNGDNGATCWIGGCWSDPSYRGQGALRALFDYLDKHVVAKGWMRQGLGVWTDNESAIKAYRALGFEDAGFRRESEKQPGRFYMHMIRDTLSK